MSVALVHFNHTLKDGLATWPSMRTSEEETNYGDVLVCDAVLHQLKGITDFNIVEFGNTLEQPADRFIMRGSTYLHNAFDFDAANKTIDSLDCSGAVAGLGMQNPTFDIEFLDANDGARNFIARLNERSKSISVRGAFTADVVRRLGGKNIRVTGCPSLFHDRRVPQVKVPDTLTSRERSVGVSVHSELGGIYCRNVPAALKAHAAVLLQALASSETVQLFEQGIRREYAITDREASREDRITAAADFLQGIGLRGILPAERLLNLFVSVHSIEEWKGKARDLDAMIGFRFHGSMISLSQGKPCYNVVYDARIEEFCRLYELPYQDVTEDLDPIGRIIAHDWDKTNRAFRDCAVEMRAFWKENGFEPDIE